MLSCFQNTSNIDKIGRNSNPVSMGTSLITMTQTAKDSTTLDKYAIKDEIRQIELLHKDGRELRKIINSIKKKKISSFINLHKKSLKESFDSNFYITGRNTLNNNNDDNEVDYLDNYQSANVSVKKINDENFENKIKTLDFTNNYDVSKNYKTSRNNLLSKIYIPRESVSNFTSKTREISKTNFLINFKKERALRIQEEYNDQMNIAKESILNSNAVKKFLGEEYLITFNKYFKTLLHRLEKEKGDLEKLVQLRMKSELEIKKINLEISKNKHIREKFLDYKNFTICVNEGIVSLPDYYIKMCNNQIENIQAETGIVLSSPVKFHPRKKSSMFANAIKNVLSNKSIIASVKVQPKLLPKDTSLEKYLNLEVSEIFNSPSDFIEKINDLEYHNISKMRISDENKLKIYNLKKDIAKISEEVALQENEFSNQVRRKEEHLNELKLKYKTFAEEKNNLMETCNINLKMDYNYSNKEIKHIRSNSLPIFNNQGIDFEKNKKRKFAKKKRKKNFLDIIFKINKINNKVTELLPNLFNEKSKFLNQNPTLQKLYEIEKIFDFLLRKYNYYKTTKEFENILHKVELNIENERHLLKINEKKIHDTLRREKMISYIKEKENDIVIIPKRKVSEKFKPIEKKIYSHRIMSKEINDDIEFFKLISYDDNL